MGTGTTTTTAVSKVEAEARRIGSSTVGQIREVVGAEDRGSSSMAGVRPRASLMQKALSVPLEAGGVAVDRLERVVRSVAVVEASSAVDLVASAVETDAGASVEVRASLVGGVGVLSVVRVRGGAVGRLASAVNVV